MSQNSISKFSPQHPLPEELQKMGRDETVCKYCGVSYLIHSEMKKMEEKMKRMEEEMKHLKGGPEREAALKEQIERYVASVDTYRKTLDDRDKVIKTVTEEIEGKQSTIADLRRTKQVLEDKLLEEITINEKKSAKIDKLQAFLPTVHKVIHPLKNELSKLKSDVQTLAATCGEGLTRLGKIQSGFSDNYTSEHTKLQSEHAELTEVNARLQQVKQDFDNGAKTLKETARKLGDLQKSHELLVASDKRSRKEVMELKECLGNEKTGKRVAESQAQQYREQVGAKVKEMETLMTNKLNNEKSMETSVLVLQDKLKAKTHACKELELERDKLRRETSQREEKQTHLEAELRRKTAASKGELADIKESLLRGEEEVSQLKEERETMISSHQNQIQDLRDSFKRKLMDAEDWQTKVEEAVREEKVRHSAEMEALQRRLKDEFDTEFQIDQQRHQELTDKYQKNLRESESKYRAEIAQMLAGHKSELGDLHRQMSEQKHRSKDSESKLKLEVTSLKNCVREMEERIARLGSGSSDKVEELKTVCREKDNEISLLKSEITVLERRVQELTEQNMNLQDTVRRECEERFELTEALSTAKEELLALKRPTGGYPAPSPRLTFTHQEQPRRHSLSSMNNQSQTAFQKPPPIREAFTTNEAVIGGDVANHRTAQTGSANQMKGGTVSDSRKRIAAAIGRR